MFSSCCTAEGTDPSLNAAFARWFEEGGAHGDAPPPLPPDSPDPLLTNAELVQLRVRMVAIENLMLALLAQTCEEPRAMARRMAAHIAPRPGFTPHRLTLHAAALMQHLGGRAREIRVQLAPPDSP